MAAECGSLFTIALGAIAFAAPREAGPRSGANEDCIKLKAVAMAYAAAAAEAPATQPRCA